MFLSAKAIANKLAQFDFGACILLCKLNMFFIDNGYANANLIL